MLGLLFSLALAQSTPSDDSPQPIAPMAAPIHIEGGGATVHAKPGETGYTSLGITNLFAVPIVVAVTVKSQDGTPDNPTPFHFGYMPQDCEIHGPSRGSDDPMYSPDWGCSMVLAPGQTSYVTVVFSPDSVGPLENDTLVVQVHALHSETAWQYKVDVPIFGAIDTPTTLTAPTQN